MGLDELLAFLRLFPEDQARLAYCRWSCAQSRRHGLRMATLDELLVFFQRTKHVQTCAPKKKRMATESTATVEYWSPQRDPAAPTELSGHRSSAYSAALPRPASRRRGYRVRRSKVGAPFSRTPTMARPHLEFLHLNLFEVLLDRTG